MNVQDEGAYTGFAEVYDLFMDNVPYDAWAEDLTALFRREEIRDGLLLDLGCGTGALTERMASAGYDMIGADISEEMIQRAMEKRDQTGSNILYLLQDMRKFELYGTVRGIYSLCDCMNYILDEQDLVQVLKLANNYLDPGGIFVFDLSTEEHYRRIGTGTIAEDRPEGSFIWDNIYREDSRLNEYDLSLFIPVRAGRQEEGGLYRKHTETHIQRAWTAAEIAAAAEAAGMRLEGIYRDMARHAAKPGDERVYVVLREQGKRSAQEI